MTAMLLRCYERLLFGLFAAAACLLLGVLALVLYDVIARNLGLPAFAHTLGLSEYALYYTTLMGAPWLVRSKHHIYLQLLTSIAGPRWRPVIAAVSYTLCAVVCLVLCYYAALVAIEAFVRADVEVRSFDMPRWLYFAIMPVSFLLMAAEFARFLLGVDAMYDAEIGFKE